MCQAKEVNPLETACGSREASDRLAEVSNGRRRRTRRLVKARMVPERGAREGSVGGGFPGSQAAEQPVEPGLCGRQQGCTPDGCHTRD
jgi:hypothetical protein